MNKEEVINKTLTFRLKPTNEQSEKLLKFAGCVRFVYNANLAYLKEKFEKKEKTPHKFEMINRLKDLKKEHPFLLEAHSQTLQQSIYDLDKALKAFFRRVKAKEAPGFPKFKSKDVSNTMRFSQHVKKVNFQNRNMLFIPKIGPMRYWDCREIEGEIKQAVVNKKGKHWYAHIVVEVQRESNVILLKVTPNSNEGQCGENVTRPIKPFAVHLGIENFAYCSDGTIVENPRFYKNMLKRLAHLQKKHSRKKKGSANRKKSAQTLARFHERIFNRRKDFLHKLSTQIVENQDIIAVQKYNMKSMLENKNGTFKNHALHRSIADAGWSTFTGYLKYKCDWANKKFIEIDALEPSAQKCAHCGCIQDMPLHKRFYDCKECGVKLHRGMNAALNIRAAGLVVLNDCGGLSVSSPVEAVISQ